MAVVRWLQRRIQKKREKRQTGTTYIAGKYYLNERTVGRKDEIEQKAKQKENNRSKKMGANIQQS